jgi:trk system potassium uptake protein TrkH
MTTRTAGFFSIPQENLTNASSILSLLFMFIGGSPAGTAGGIKTVTIAVVIASAIATIKNKNDTNLFNRKISKDIIRKSIAVVFVSFCIVFISTLLLAISNDADFMKIIYETVSATATVGLSKNLTSTLNDFGKLVIILAMYLGRVGPISLAIAFNVKRENKNIIKNPREDVCVG